MVVVKIYLPWYTANSLLTWNMCLTISASENVEQSRKDERVSDEGHQTQLRKILNEDEG